MAGLNKVILIGRIGKDPDTYSFDDGTKKISFSLATTESYKDRNSGDWVEQTEWHNIVGYRFLADKNFAKGDLVYVEGKIKTRKYSDRDGNERYITEIIGEKINILTRSQSSYESTGQQATTTRDETPAAPAEPLANDQPAAGAPDDDLPF
ncbi:MAG: single-stranded DNA-binding protein [Bacteroidetes bacterium]|nr:MAG: single-stranded DNA-binding protein [Bacteroidota bacterium]